MKCVSFRPPVSENAVVDGVEDMSDFPEQRSTDLSELIYRAALSF